MTFRGYFLADGPSDLPLAEHLEWMCAEAGYEVRVAALDPRSMRAGRSVQDRLRFVLSQDSSPDVLFIHRDAEGSPVSARVEEIASGALAAGFERDRVVAVIPVRMTEAWLLLDESEIRRTAGRPSGREPLGLPAVARVESVADPKSMLAAALLRAGAPSGKRRRLQFERDFGEHRALLLKRLDRSGPIREVPSWQRLRADVVSVLGGLAKSP